MSGTHISGVPAGSPGSNLTQGQVWGKGRRSAFLPGALGPGDGGWWAAASSPFRMKRGWALSWWVALPLQGPKQLVLTWPQLRKQLLLSQHLFGKWVLRPQPCPHCAMADTMQGRLEGPADALYFTDGKTDGNRNGRDSLKFTQQVVARPQLEPICPEVCSTWWGLGSPYPGTVVVCLRVRGNWDGGGGSQSQVWHGAWRRERTGQPLSGVRGQERRKEGRAAPGLSLDS